MAGSWLEGRGESGGQKENHKGKVQVVDGSDIQKLVEDKEVFGCFVESKFRALDLDGDGELSVKELEPAIADIGAALGLPAPGTSPDSDHIYAEVLNEFTHGKHKKVTKSEFRKVLSDILLGMAAGLKRDPIVILRIDGEDLGEFLRSARFEPEAASIFSGMESANATLHQCLARGLEQLKVEDGMPPSSDSWVMKNIIEPALRSHSADLLEGTASQDVFLEQFKKLLEEIAGRLKEHPVIVAHSENTFDGSGIKKLLSNKFELDKLLDAVWRDLPQDRKNKTSKEYIRVVLDRIAASVDLPPYGAVEQVDAVVNEAIKMVNADDGKIVEEGEFKKTVTEVLGSIMLQLQGNSIFVSTDSVVHEPLTPSPPSSSLLPPLSL